MKYSLFAAAFCLLFASFTFTQSDEINIIPKPRSVKKLSGAFKLTKNTRIVALDEAGRKMAGLLNDLLVKNYGFKLKINSKPPTNNYIQFLPPDLSIRETTLPGRPNLLHSIKIQPDRIEITGYEEGLFYGLQSLKQLLPLEFKSSIEIPALLIVDYPRFGYRGMHLDVGRHFMPVEFVKKYIDLMSQYKFNNFHWHLTEDQGWRIEIKKYPKLTEIGSKRPESMKEKNFTPYIGDGVPEGGFYTQEQIKDVVAYANARYINVIPEIELPGHSSAALAAYPELGCKADYKYKVQTTWGIFKEVYCPTEKTFGFLEDVLTEVIGLFPDSPYIHIGGDEVLKDMWKESPEVRELMARENLKDEREVQSYFIRRMEKFINSKGKKIIGWDEILEGGLAPNATVMSWRGIKGGIEAARAKHDVIMTPTDYSYFDYGQGDPATEPINIGGYLNLEKVYSFDPVPKELAGDDAKYILGGQANIWTEYLQTPAAVEYMAFPRMLAMAEDVWTTPENKNFVDFSRRLSSHYAQLDKQGVNYRIPEPGGLQNIVTENEKAVITLTPARGTVVIYTIDGSDPNVKSSEQYNQPLAIPLKVGEAKTLKTIVISSAGRKSVVYGATLLRHDYLKPAELAEKRPGVTFGFITRPANGSTDPVLSSGETKTTGLQQFAKTTDLKGTFGVTFDGYLNIPADGMYEFQAESTWDTAVFIDGEKLIEDAGIKDRKIRSAIIPLRAGLHKVSLRYNNHGGDPFFRVRWAIKGQNWRNIGGGELVH